MRKALPVRANLSYLKQEAKELKLSVANNNYSVSYRIAEHLCSYQMGAPLSLTDAQFVIAREYGFASWPKLKQALQEPKTKLSLPSVQPATDWVNLVCGDIASTALKDAGVTGQRMPWKDLLCIGPLANHSTDHDFLLQRAEFIRSWTQLPGLPDASKMAFRELQMLKNTLESKAVVFWIWPHLSNQLMLLFLLNWYQTNNYQGQLLWVDASKTPNRVDQNCIRNLIGSQTPITLTQQQYATLLWQALGRDNPQQLISILKEREEALPRFKRALWRYIQELANINTGLSLLQHRVLEALQNGCHTPHAIYKYVHRDEKYHIAGDWYLWHLIADMTNCQYPLLKRADKQPFIYPPVDMQDEFNQQNLVITETGQEVLAGKKCHIQLNNIGKPWGGLSTEEYKQWRYDPKSKSCHYIGVK